VVVPERFPKREKDPYPPVGGSVRFIEATSFKKPKLLVLYAIASGLSHGTRYSRSDIDDRISAARRGLDHNRQKDDRYAPDQLLRNLIDVGYLEDDGRRTVFWLGPKARPIFPRAC